MRRLMNVRILILSALFFSSAVAPAALEDEEFAQIHRQLRPASEGWSSIPWRTSLVQACVQAVREKKPLFMVSRSGHPLGCV